MVLCVDYVDNYPDWLRGSNDMAIESICKSNVQFAFRDTPITVAARLMRDKHVGDLVIVNNEQGRIPVGMLTDRDIVVGVVADSVPLDQVRVDEVMSSSVITVREDQEISEVTELMGASGVQRVPVVNEQGSLCGIVSLDDALGAIAGELFHLAGLRARARDKEARMRVVQSTL